MLMLMTNVFLENTVQKALNTIKAFRYIPQYLQCTIIKHVETSILSYTLTYLFRTEVVIYLMERDPTGNSRRFPASEVSNFLKQANMKVYRLSN